MTQITAEQQQLQATAESAFTKVGTCVDGLPDDERTVLTAVLQQLNGADDTAGYFFRIPTPGILGTAGSNSRGSSGGLDAINSVDWQKVYEALGAR